MSVRGFEHIRGVGEKRCFERRIVAAAAAAIRAGET